MNKKENNINENKDVWAIGGGLLIGLGMAFFFLERSPLFFVGSIILGLGIGIIIAAVLPRICK